jgi:Flp pilus assembly protein TadG
MKRICASRLIRRWKDTTGANIVEAALITPLLLLMTFSIVDFGSLFYVYLALENGVSQAGRFGVTGNVTGALNREESIKDAMRKATPTLAIDDAAFAFSFLPRNPPAGPVVWLAGTGNPGDISKVKVTYSWALMTPFIRELFPGGKLTIKVESAMLNEPRFE